MLKIPSPEFLRIATRFEEIWEMIPEIRTEHKFYGVGELIEKGESNIVIKYPQPVQAKVGETDTVEFKIAKAFNSKVITKIIIPKKHEGRWLESKKKVDEIESKERQLLEQKAKKQAELEAEMERKRMAILRLAKKHRIEEIAAEIQPDSIEHKALLWIDSEEEVINFPNLEEQLIKNQSFQLLALIYKKQGKLAKAGSCWRKAKCPYRALEITESAIENQYILTMRGGAFRDLGQYKKARISANRAIELDSEVPHPWNLLGAIEFDQKNYEEGERCFREAENRGSAMKEMLTSYLRTQKWEQKAPIVDYLLDVDSQKYGWLGEFR